MAADSPTSVQTISAAVNKAVADLERRAAQDDRSEQAEVLTKANVELERDLLDAVADQEELRILRAQNDNFEQDTRLRKEYAGEAFGLAFMATIYWMSMFTLVAIFNAASGKPMLSDTGLITLTTGATVNVLAAFLVVVRGIFTTGSMKHPGLDRSQRAK